MRKIGRYRRKKQNKFLIIGSLSLLLFLCVGYAAFSTELNLKAKGNIKEKSRVIQSWSSSAQTDFHSYFYKQNIVSVTFLDNNNVPSNATESWNVSEDKENGGVMAWVIPSSNDNTKYDLYIGAPAGVIANEDSSYLFREFRSVVSIEFNNNFDTSNVVNMSQMFNNCTSLVQLDLSSFDTTNVTSMFSMFCMWDNGFPENKLQNIIFGEKFITDNVTSMRNMFAGLTELQSLDLRNFNTGNVTDMYHMFNRCRSLQNLDLRSFNTSKVTNMEQMFGRCINLESLDLSSFDTGNVTTMSQMFYECSKLKSLNLCSFNTQNIITMYQMFCNTENLTQINVGPNWTMANVTDAFQMFQNSGVSSVTTGQC